MYRHETFRIDPPYLNHAIKFATWQHPAVGAWSNVFCVQHDLSCTYRASRFIFSSIFTSDKGGGKCVCPSLSVGLSVCLSVSKITKNVCMDLDEMLHVDRCRDMDELINF